MKRAIHICLLVGIILIIIGASALDSESITIPLIVTIAGTVITGASLIYGRLRGYIHD